MRGRHFYPNILLLLSLTHCGLYLQRVQGRILDLPKHLNTPPEPTSTYNQWGDFKWKPMLPKPKALTKPHLRYAIPLLPKYLKFITLELLLQKLNGEKLI